MKARLLITLLMTAAVLAMMAAPASAEHYGCGELTFSVSPTSGPAGSLVTVSGSGAYPNDSFNILWDHTHESGDPPVGSASSDGSFNFSGQFSVPAGASPGTHEVVIDGYDSEDESVFCAAAFTVTESAGQGVTPDQPPATGPDTPASQTSSSLTSTGSTTTTATSLPSTGFPLLLPAALALGGLTLAALGWQRRS